MKMLLLSDVDILAGFVATTCFLVFTYIFRALGGFKVYDWDEIEIAGALVWFFTWFIRRMAAHVYVALKKKYELKDRGIYF